MTHPTQENPASKALPITCNACGSELTVRFPKVRDPQSLEWFSIEVCSECGLGHTLPQPADLGRYYGKAYHGGRHGFTARYCAWRRTRMVHRVAGPAGGRNLLDIGCGDGTFLLAAREKGWNVAGTEMNPSTAREAGLPVWETLDEVRHLAPFACMTMWQTLEHMRDPRATVAEAVELLEHGGHLFVAVPDAEGMQAKVFGEHWFHLDVPRHLYHFGNRALTRLLETAGLEVVRRWHQEFEIDLFGWSQSALNRVMRVPNVFFYQLTGRPTRVGPSGVAASFAIGTVLSAAALPLTAAGSISSSGGTLVVAARRP
jgi:SAM-dependent methyltransferase